LLSGICVLPGIHPFVCFLDSSSSMISGDEKFYLIPLGPVKTALSPVFYYMIERLMSNWSFPFFFSHAIGRCIFLLHPLLILCIFRVLRSSYFFSCEPFFSSFSIVSIAYVTFHCHVGKLCWKTKERNSFISVCKWEVPVWFSGDFQVLV